MITHIDRREGVIEMIEKVLERAKRGEVRGIAIAMQLPENDIGTAYWFAEGGNVWQLLGAVDAVKHRLLETHVSDD